MRHSGHNGYCTSQALLIPGSHCEFPWSLQIVVELGIVTSCPAYANGSLKMGLSPYQPYLETVTGCSAIPSIWLRTLSLPADVR
jgi:hypothetical protein